MAYFCMHTVDKTDARRKRENDFGYLNLSNEPSTLGAMSQNVRTTIVYQRRRQYKNSFAIPSVRPTIVYQRRRQYKNSFALPSDGFHYVISPEEKVSFFERVIKSPIECVECFSGANEFFNECPKSPIGCVERFSGAKEFLNECLKSPIGCAECFSGTNEFFNECSKSPIRCVECFSGVNEFFNECSKSPIVCAGCFSGANEFFNEWSAHSHEEASLSSVDRVLDIFCFNDNCSNLEPNSVSLKINADDAGESSSSGTLLERDICISILRKRGLLDEDCTREKRASRKDIDNNYCSKPCETCGVLDSTLTMLICDSCEGGFHISCCNPCITRIPVGEWVFGSCLKTKHTISNETSESSSVDISSEIGINGYSSSDEELGSLEFMFRDVEPYMSNVRIGDEFQANVPDWGGPVYSEIDDWLEMDPSNNASMKCKSYTKPLKLSSIGNWLQCQESVKRDGDGDEGTICGKWRRAPLFEVQSDKWVCFCCVLWDPCRADCAVPQEVDTEEVMRQLKYMQMLRPQIAAKRRKLDRSKRIFGSQDQSK